MSQAMFELFEARLKAAGYPVFDGDLDVDDSVPDYFVVFDSTDVRIAGYVATSGEQIATFRVMCVSRKRDGVRHMATVERGVILDWTPDRRHVDPFREIESGPILTAGSGTDIRYTQTLVDRTIHPRPQEAP